MKIQITDFVEGARQARELKRAHPRPGFDAGKSPVDLAALPLAGRTVIHKFFDPACPWAPEQDFEPCTAVDSLDFAIRLDSSRVPPSLIAAGSMPA